MSVQLPRQTLEYVSFPVSTAPVDPATLTHEVALVPETEQPAGWFSALFADGEVRVLVRATNEAPAGGDVTLDIGRWRLWWRTASNPELPVRQVGIVQVV